MAPLHLLKKTVMNQSPDLFRLPSSERYVTAVKAIKASQAIYTLADEAGCFILSTGTTNALPVWTDEAQAQAWQQKESGEFQILAIEASTLKEKWLPGMANDGFQIAVIPNLAGECIVLDADEFLQDLNA